MLVKWNETSALSPDLLFTLRITAQLEGGLQDLFCHLLRGCNCLIQANKSLTGQLAEKKEEKGSYLITWERPELGKWAPWWGHCNPASPHPVASMPSVLFTYGRMFRYLVSTAQTQIPGVISQGWHCFPRDSQKSQEPSVVPLANVWKDRGYTLNHLYVWCNLPHRGKRSERL